LRILPRMPHRKFLLQAMLGLGLTTLLIAPLRAVTDTDSVQDQIRNLIAETVRANEPGVAVLVRKNGETLVQLTRGVRDLRSKTEIDAATNFRLASCTKQFTAMAIMLLVRDGKLRYDERLTDILPEFPAYGHAIAIYQLLNHTSGLPDYEELMEKAHASKAPQWTATHQITDAEVLKLLEGEQSGKFSPGKHWAYSNSGYVVLGLIVSKVSGRSFPEFLHDRIFKPLAMNNTVAYVSGANDISNRAYGHSTEKGALVETDQSATSATLGDGGIYSSLEDLAKWDEGLSRHSPLSEAEMRAALIPVATPEGAPHWDSGPGDADPIGGKPVWYGFGWFLDPYKGHRRMWHYGETMGFKSSIQRFTNDNLSVIVLTNRSDVDAIGLSTKISDFFLK
jgi:CubicO group peptidase (beta-lactamase class C family)